MRTRRRVRENKEESTSEQRGKYFRTKRKVLQNKEEST